MMNASSVNFDDDGLFFDMVNKHRDEVNLSDAKIKELNEKINNISKAVEKSIRNTDDEIIYKRQVEKNKKANRKFVAYLLAVMLLLGVSLNVAGRTINEHLIISAVQLSREESVDGFLTYTDSLGNSDSYSRIGSADVITVYILKDRLSPEEFSKFISSQTYVDPITGEVNHYVNFTHYLSVNGLENDKEFKKAAEEAMLNYYNENNLPNPYTNINVNSSVTKGVR